jgi:hypothetical protein
MIAIGTSSALREISQCGLRTHSETVFPVASLISALICISSLVNLMALILP